MKKTILTPNGINADGLHDKVINVLLVEDDFGDAELVLHALSGKDDRYNIVHVERMAAALEAVREEEIDVILLDLTLPDATGLSTFIKMHQEVTGIPIVVLTGLDDNRLALQAVEKGAQDYLSKQHVDGNLLPRVIRHAVQRQSLVNELRHLSLTDELTGLYNRRGFIFLAQQRLQDAGRHLDERFIFLFIDMDKMKYINDHFGHQAGDDALMDFSAILKETFRSSDIVGRVGGDEFAILAVEHGPHRFPHMIGRLNDMITGQNTGGKRPYRLEFSVGMIPYDPRHPSPVQELLKQADQLMYEQKRAKKQARSA